jgi:hypothetical protein
MREQIEWDDLRLIAKLNEFLVAMGPISVRQRKPVCPSLALSAELLEVLQPFQCQVVISVSSFADSNQCIVMEMLEPGALMCLA